jgi:NAD(P)-dependent dehydrogenase (short-subunit alcohol dehydrogenase family)
VPSTDDRPRRALVTGGTGGIGTACVERLRADGYEVVVAWRTTPPASGPAVQFDVTDAEAVAAGIEHVETTLGPIDVVVANAGWAHIDLATHVSPERFRDVVDTDLTGAFLVARSALRPMLRRRAGRLIFIGSAAGAWGVPGLSSYSAAKAGMAGLARSLAREVGKRNITVNVVAPGIIENGANLLIEAHKAGRATVDGWLATTPAGRTGTLAEVSAAVSFLASDRAGYITGAVLPVDGGFTLGAG